MGKDVMPPSPPSPPLLSQLWPRPRMPSVFSVRPTHGLMLNVSKPPDDSVPDVVKCETEDVSKREDHWSSTPRMMVRPSLSETSQVLPSSQLDMSADSASGPPLPSRPSIPSTAPITRRDSPCQDQSWPMLISKESFKLMKSRPP